MNILLTSAGRRNYMVSYFKQAVKPFQGKVFVTNSEQHAAAMPCADQSFISPLIYESCYKDFLLDICLKNQVELIIPLFDIDIPVLASFKEEFLTHGIQILVPSKEFAEIANDKWKTYLFLKENHISTPNTYHNLATFKNDYSNHLVQFPLILKPRWGMGSLGIYKVHDMKELKFFYALIQKKISESYLKYESKQDSDNAILIQQYLDAEEYGLDVINNLKGVYQNTIVKKKIAMRAGETDAATVVKYPELEMLGRKLAELSKHPAVMDVDIFVQKEQYFVLELNPRFGGGYPFSHAAGANVPKAVVQWQQQISFNALDLLNAKENTTSYKGIQMISV